MMKKNKEIGNRICEKRKEMGLSQIYIVREINITKSMFSKYENGLNIPKADVLGKIAKVLNVTTDYLIFGMNKK